MKQSENKPIQIIERYQMKKRNMHNIRFFIYVLKRGGSSLKKYSLLLFCMLLILAGCVKESDDQTSKQAIKEQEPKTEKEEKRHMTLTEVGDILIHDRVYNVAKTGKRYDFEPMLKEMEPYLQAGTVTFANQESVMGGSKLGVSTYPSFNSPKEIGEQLKEYGVDVVNLANNHTLDRGEDAILSSIKHWKDLDMMYFGAYESKEDQETLRVYDTEEGISLGFVGYTYGTNGIEVPAGKEYLVNYIDREQMKKDIQEANQKADVTVVSLHFGIEYETNPNQEQKELVQLAADEGADIVLGHHPHVLQPVEWLEGKDGHQTFVAYSLGNFFTGQEELANRIGGILNLEIEKDKDGEIEIHSPSFMPTYVSHGDWKMQPLYRVTKKELKQADKEYEETKKHMSKWVKDLEFPEE